MPASPNSTWTSGKRRSACREPRARGSPPTTSWSIVAARRHLSWGGAWHRLAVTASLSGSRVEENGLIEERSIRLLDALEGRTDTLLGLLQRERDARLALKQRLAELEAARLALAERNSELEANRLELVEECRELDEQNRELEEHNRRLHERLNSQGEGQGTGFSRPARRSQGLSALIGRSATSAATSTDVGARLVGRSAEAADAGADANAKSPDKSGSYNAAAATGALPVGGRLCRANGGDGEVNSGASLEEPAATPAATTTTDVGARLVGRSAEATATATGADANAKSPDKSGSYNAAAATDAAATTDAPSPQALLAEWYQRYPGAFFKGHTRPLKVGIHEALAEQEPWPEKLVRRALACYVNLPRYLKAVREGAERIDLDGKPAGQVDAKAAEHARKKLERLQAEGRGKGGAVPGQSRRAAGKGKPGRGGRGKSQAGKGATGKAPAAQAAPGAEPPQPARSAPATMEEKLAALVAKHRQQ